ncbi:MAG: hypothetical protein KC978_03145 [Candidatus Omnitrophica bacterium]|nr:hypothetical protein [Candidatus Omnitrophota bacterium]
MLKLKFGIAFAGALGLAISLAWSPAVAADSPWDEVVNPQSDEVWMYMSEEKSVLDDTSYWGPEPQVVTAPLEMAPPANESVWVAQAEKQAKEGSSGDGKSLSEKAVDPTAILKQMQFQDVVIPETYGADGYANQFILQPVLPVPASKGFPLTQIIRPTLPYISTADPDGPLGEKDAWGDLTVLDLFVKKCSFGTVGIGPTMIFPTATSDFTGQGKYQAGPAFVAIINTVPKWTLGVLAYNPISFAGDDDRDAVSTFTFQPIAIRQLGDGWYTGWGDFTMTYEWHSNNYAIPLSWKIGKVTQICGQSVNLFAEPFYTPWHDGPTPEWGAKFSVTLLFP